MMWVMKIIGVMLCVPFYTLLERKVLSYSQNRKGPKKVSMIGLLQPVSDGMKLMIKSSGAPLSANFMLFYLFPLVSFLLTVGCLFFFPSKKKGMLMNLGVLGMICLSSLGVYTLLGAGWSSKSKYSLLGCIRGASQVISYEMKLMFLIIFPCGVYKTYNLKEMYMNSALMLGFMVLTFLWVFSVLCETKRAPFDFAEGESELVSGFKTEYSSLLFTFLFLSEYGNIMFFSWFLSCMFCMKGLFMTSFFFFFWVLFSFLWARATFPRFRYDFLMMFSWCVCLPVVTIIFWFSFLF